MIGWKAGEKCVRVILRKWYREGRAPAWESDVHSRGHAGRESRACATRFDHYRAHAFDLAHRAQRVTDLDAIAFSSRTFRQAEIVSFPTIAPVIAKVVVSQEFKKKRKERTSFSVISRHVLLKQLYSQQCIFLETLVWKFSQKKFPRPLYLRRTRKYHTNVLNVTYVEKVFSYCPGTTEIFKLDRAIEPPCMTIKIMMILINIL